MQRWNRLSRFLLVCSLLIGLCAGILAPRLERAGAKPLGACPGGIITQWTFFGSVTTPSTGSGTFNSGSGLGAIAFVTGNPDQAANFNNWSTSSLDETDYVEFRVSTTGRSLIRFTFDFYRSNTGPTNLQVRYSSDGVNFVDFGSPIPVSAATTWFTQTINFNAIPALDDNPNASFRIYGYSASGGAGTLRFDNVTISEICPPSIAVLINEVAWAGTIASSDDEWIELHNPGVTDIDLTGWRLIADDGSPDITFNSATCYLGNCIISSGGYFLLERGHDAVTDQQHNLIYFGSLADTSEILRLRAPDGTIIDTANSDGGDWPAGNATTRSSMERVGAVADGNLSWTTFQGTGTARDAANNLINGSPGAQNAMVGITPTFTPSITPSPTVTLTLTPTITPTPPGLRSVIINEIAWAGTVSGLPNDEWIELYNPTSAAINLTGWRITAADGTPNIILSGTIPAGGYFLLERTDDGVVSDIAADQLYSGALSNDGETLTLFDPVNRLIDTANSNGGGWPAGSSSTFGTMERNGVVADSDSAWHTNTGAKRNGKNRNGGDILGTPKSANSSAPSSDSSSNRTATPTPTRTPVLVPIQPRPIINEILARPGFDWNRDGSVNVFDEFIEVKNLSPIDINLRGWKLDRVSDPTRQFTLPDVILRPGQRAVFYGLQTNLLLSDGGETVRLIHPNGDIYDAYTYSIARTADQSFCRLPDVTGAFGTWNEDCIPTPNLVNTREGEIPSLPGGKREPPLCDLPDTLPAGFLLAECRGYGANIWNPFYWDQFGWRGGKSIPQNTSKWEAIIE